jgi:excisionase family DNA binding protein
MKYKEFINDKDLAKLLNISVDTIRAHRKNGKGLTYYKFGNNIRYSIEDVEKYITDKKRGVQNHEQ